MKKNKEKSTKKRVKTHEKKKKAIKPPENNEITNPYQIKAYKFTAKKKKEFLRLIREEGMRRTHAIKEVGIARQTLAAHLKDDPALKNALDQAEMDQAAGKNEEVEDALFDAATSGNVTAIQVYLYNRLPESWSDKRTVAHTGPGGGPIQTDVVVLTPEERKKKLESIIERTRGLLTDVGADILPGVDR